MGKIKKCYIKIGSPTFFRYNNVIINNILEFKDAFFLEELEENKAKVVIPGTTIVTMMPKDDLLFTIKEAKESKKQYEDEIQEWVNSYTPINFLNGEVSTFFKFNNRLMSTDGGPFSYKGCCESIKKTKKLLSFAIPLEALRLLKVDISYVEKWLEFLSNLRSSFKYTTYTTKKINIITNNAIRIKHLNALQPKEDFLIIDIQSKGLEAYFYMVCLRYLLNEQYKIPLIAMEIKDHFKDKISYNDAFILSHWQQVFGDNCFSRSTFLKPSLNNIIEDYVLLRGNLNRSFIHIQTDKQTRETIYELFNKKDYNELYNFVKSLH